MNIDGIIRLVGLCCQMRGKSDLFRMDDFGGSRITVIAGAGQEPVYWYPVRAADGRKDWIVGPTDTLTRQLAELSSICEPHESPTDIDQYAGRALIDVHFFICAVHIERADFHRAEFWRLIEPDIRFLKSGPTDIAIGERLGDQGLALCFMALGEAMGFWGLHTLAGPLARRPESVGYLKIVGFKEPAP